MRRAAASNEALTATMMMVEVERSSKAADQNIPLPSKSWSLSSIMAGPGPDDSVNRDHKVSEELVRTHLQVTWVEFRSSRWHPSDIQ